jgi:DNA-directed RNA polymerase specialized sigma24 family protein
MLSPSLGLLDRLMAESAVEADRSWFAELYRPFLVAWLTRVPGLAERAEGLATEILAVVTREIAHHNDDRDGPFRGWLRRILVKRSQDRMLLDGRSFETIGKVENFLRRLADPSSDLAREWDAEHDRHVTRQMLGGIHHEFSPTTWEAFRQFAIDGSPAAIVALRLGLAEMDVIRAKARILRRLREEAGNLLG